MSTDATGLTRVGRIHFDSRSSSLFRFGEQLVKKSRPRGIGNALGKTMILGHAMNRQIFNGNDPKGSHDFPALLMGEILTPELDSLMDTRHGFAVLTAFRSTFRQLAMSALYFRQGFLFLAEKARVGNLFTV